MGKPIADKILDLSDYIVELNTTKTKILEAIESKGIEVGETEFRDYNLRIRDIWGGPGFVPIILGVLGEPSEDSELTRWEHNSYDLTPTLITNPDNSNYMEWHFDTTKWPYSEMTEVIIGNNVYIKVPKMWVKLDKDGTKITGRYVAPIQIDENWKIPKCYIDHRDGETELDYALVGKYNGNIIGGVMGSKTGETVAVSDTLANFRAAAMANNVEGDRGYQLIDMHFKFVLETLYLLVFANTNSDVKFPQGSSGSNQVNGILDGMTHHTGYTKGTTNWLMKFMGIENYFSNVLTQVDGVKINNREVFVCDNPLQYNSDSNTTNYYKIGTVNATGLSTDNVNISALGVEEGLFSLPIGGGGTDFTKYYGDGVVANSGYRTLYFGRTRHVYSYYGLFYWYGNHDFSHSGANLGSRLVKKPLP